MTRSFVIPASSQWTILKYHQDQLAFMNYLNNFRRRILKPHPLPPLSQVLFIQPSSPLLSRSYANSTFTPSSFLPSSRPSSKQYIKAFIVSGFLFGTSLTLYENSENRLVNKGVRKGTQPELNISSDKYFPRPRVSNQLKKIFTPQKYFRSHYIIFGKHGIGKSTLIKMAIKEVGQGVIYVDIPLDTDDFGRSFAKAMNIKISDLNNKYKKESWKVVLDAFEKAAKVHKEKYGKPLVIIYDNVDRLIHKNIDILDLLHSSVTESDNKENYVAVFVGSEYAVPQRLSSRAYWTHLDYFEIGDLTKNESIEYLITKKKITLEDAIEIYEVIGGCIADLEVAADDLISGQSVEDIKRKIKVDVEHKFRDAKIFPNEKYYEAGRNIINALLNSKELCLSELWKFSNYSESDNEILGKRLFTYHPETHTITLQSKSTEYYIRENAKFYIK
ncbi:hypothetical protein Glove_461g69 [Diversispora epigaea]|uniref:AAA+ ATPase domain-containing protein n=1 Tax=Diversispora epigaea TaxID=1348612 RepID=A0A397GTL1_9GLOM|nr:hypothetical protein Glove_461g69 [Diversispora epigaea]